MRAALRALVRSEAEPCRLWRGERRGRSASAVRMPFAERWRREGREADEEERGQERRR